MRVFVYGSLLPGMSHYAVAEPYVKAAEPGRVRGKLVDVGPYPALLLEGSGFVRGIWLEIAGGGLPKLDEWEDFIGIEEQNDYERVWIRDADRPDIAGWVYVWAASRGYPEADGDWWPDIWRRKQPESG